MSQSLPEEVCVSVALIAMVSPPAMAQAALAPPPQIPYGVSVSIESARNVAATACERASAWVRPGLAIQPSAIRAARSQQRDQAVAAILAGACIGEHLTIKMAALSEDPPFWARPLAGRSFSE
jgi:hypothetical protein